ncbi:unnamed protein product [Heligmosomoides polygyrus]|uniref:Midasin n=1 Tax=Heligmosomoides polygyrus TaxID=6339 RepID=A0A3P8C9Q9_HELPZ|nr:unnamed protein product [Heligmosomoides polygyrus]
MSAGSASRRTTKGRGSGRAGVECCPLRVPDSDKDTLGDSEMELESKIEDPRSLSLFLSESISASDASRPSILPTRESLAHQLMVALRGRHFTIIEGPMGSGKTFIASYASRQLSLPLKTMQMGDQVDSKNLFGCYHCTEVAGQFLWKPSSFCQVRHLNYSNFMLIINVLSFQWLQEPGLILLEDIDLSNADVTSTVVELISRRSASLPCGDVVSLHQDVCLVATVSGKGKRCSVLDGVPVRIKLEQLTDEDDLLRGCARVNKLSDLSSNISIFTELLDSWCLAESPDRATVLCKKVAAALSITEDQMSFHLSLRQPSFTHDDSSCVVGRCRLPCSPSLNSTQKHRLGHTRDVLQLMERLAVCVQHREPVLLVGETGVGKTSIVQSLASALNVTLKVVNLSPSSDTDELISGYKPASISHVLQPFTHFYHDVFADNFDVKRNQKFLSHLEDPRWASVIVRGKRIQENLKNGAAFLFAVSRGAVLEAAQEGYWLLIDEVCCLNFFCGR